MERKNISEIFVSIQGEGRYAGQVSVFIRFQGCNLNCSFCDTKYSIENKPGDYSIIDALNFITKHEKIRHIVITGGEPLLYQDDIRRIIDENEEAIITIETNGSLPLDKESVTYFQKKKIVLSISPKSLKDCIESPQYLTIDHFWKLVDTPSFSWLEKGLKQLRVARIYNEVYLMPEALTREEYLKNAPDTAKKCIKYNLKFSPRLHIVIWDTKRGV